MKKILLVCGTGVATSTVARNRVEEYLNSNGYKGQFSINQATVAEAASMSGNYDFIVSTVAFDGSNCKCPVILGTYILIGINVQPIYDQIVEEMKK